jgi:hypothetical protein
LPADNGRATGCAVRYGDAELWPAGALNGCSRCFEVYQRTANDLTGGDLWCAFARAVKRPDLRDPSRQLLADLLNNMRKFVCKQAAPLQSHLAYSGPARRQRDYQRYKPPPIASGLTAQRVRQCGLAPAKDYDRVVAQRMPGLADRVAVQASGGQHARSSALRCRRLRVLRRVWLPASLFLAGCASPAEL